MSSRFIHVVACVRISFLVRLNNGPLYVYATFCLPLHPLMDTSVILAIVNDAAMNMGLQISLQDPAFKYVGYMLGTILSGILTNWVIPKRW